MKIANGDFPLQIKISFSQLFDKYREQVDSTNRLTRARALEILEVEKEYPILTNGLTTQKEVQENREAIDLVLDDIFTPVLQNNEIKFATIPYLNIDIKSTQRHKDILKKAGEKYEPILINFEEDQKYILGCSIILNAYYGYNIDFKRPLFYNIPNKNGTIKNYRVTYNAEFFKIEKTNEAIDITTEDLNLLLESFEDINLWKEKFPPNSWILKGFGIANLVDVTMDVSISDFKTNLLRREIHGGTMNQDFARIFRSIFNLTQLKIGFTDYNEEKETFQKALYKDIDSFILNGKTSQACKDALCSTSHYTIFKLKDIYCITDAERYNKLYPENLLYKKLLKQGFKSALLAAIVEDDKLLGVLELVSPNANELNTINANKLKDVMPFLIDSVVRAKQRSENDIELVIQEECTAIHPSVHWKFKKEAQRYLSDIAEGNPTFYREIVFKDVYPLYGQIDIKGSSEARNLATQLDLKLQLQHIQKIIVKINRLEPLPIYESLDFRIVNYLAEIKDKLQVDSERNVFSFLNSEIIPLFTHLSSKNEDLNALVLEYYELIDSETGFVYKHRKDYDDSVMHINKRLASILDKQQIEAQKMYPHYFERFKTDGVEHNMYIGESITKAKSFNKIYLNNLKLWQLQVMCDMENNFYRFKDNLPVALDVASMILAFNGSLSLRFRMDEKRFDVDGTYNARYEVIKKRVDKANINGTEERVTQAGKIAIIYSQAEDEAEYLKYIGFLQFKKMLDKDVEMLELEELQGVTGLKAIRVSVLYTRSNDNSKEYYTYEDLLTQINA